MVKRRPSKERMPESQPSRLTEPLNIGQFNAPDIKMSVSESARGPAVEIDFEPDAALTESWLRRIIQRAREAKEK
jgi:hypothetical protein